MENIFNWGWGYKMGKERSDILAKNFYQRYDFLYGNHEIIAGEGPGEGFASYPWALDKYERSLGLCIQETWILKRLLKYSWTSEGIVYPSIRNMERESGISRPTIYKYINSLISKGYLDYAGQIDSIRDRRVRYNISGLINALGLAIMLNPKSDYALQRGAEDITKYFDIPIDFLTKINTPGEINEYYNKQGLRFNWRNHSVEKFDFEKNKYKKVYTKNCSICDAIFTSHSGNAKYCVSCKEKRKAESWSAFSKRNGIVENPENN